MRINDIKLEEKFIGIAVRLLEVLNSIDMQSTRLHLDFKINFRQASVLSFFFSRKACESFIKTHELNELELESIDDEMTAFDVFSETNPEVIEMISPETLQELVAVAEELQALSANC